MVVNSTGMGQAILRILSSCFLRCVEVYQCNIGQRPGLWGFVP